ncbi:DUF305 domain-containing protein [Actinoplanes sp. NPDC049265]|uniref:DUF305 domain-containing protein n=1 Tax=Actinoplanes sp. NPDC049265 TaxID=3363902 RepID=UPI00371BAC15
MGTHLTKRGPRRGGAHAVLAALLAMLVAGCGSEAPAAPEAPATNATDVMYAQMTVEHISQGRPVLDLAVDRGTAPELIAVATQLRDEWKTENTTLTGWLTGWGKPATADPNESVHAGHGALHALRPRDVDELRTAKDQDFDRTAVALLLGHLHNGMETARMEAGGGAYPPAVDLARTTTMKRQAEIQRLLTLAAGQ